MPTFNADEQSEGPFLEQHCDCDTSLLKEQNLRHSRAADLTQEGADQTFVTPADVPLKRAFQPVLDVAHLDPAGVPGDAQATQRGSQHKVVLPQLTRGAEAQQGPQLRVQEDLAQPTAGEGQALTAVLVQEGEKMEETLVIQLGEVHGLRGREEKGPLSANGDRPAGLTATMSLQSVLCGLDT